MKQRLMEHRALRIECAQLRRILAQLEGEGGFGLPVPAECTRLHSVLQKKLERGEGILQDTEGRIKGLGGREQTILHARYIQGESWAQVCRTSGYEQAQVFRIHAGAVRRLEEGSDHCSPSSEDEDSI